LRISIPWINNQTKCGFFDDDEKDEVNNDDFFDNNNEELLHNFGRIFVCEGLALWWIQHLYNALCVHQSYSVYSVYVILILTIFIIGTNPST